MLSSAIAGTTERSMMAQANMVPIVCTLKRAAGEITEFMF